MRKTFFEQVPLEVVNKIVDEHSGQEEASRASADEERRRTTMDAEGLEFPEWQVQLQEAILEFDEEKFREKQQSMETVIFERLQQLGPQNNGYRERQALNNGLWILKLIAMNRHE